MDDEKHPAEFPKMVYRGGEAYDEFNRVVAHEHGRVVRNAEEEEKAKAEGFVAYDLEAVPEPLFTDTLPHTVVATGTVEEPGLAPAAMSTGTSGDTGDALETYHEQIAPYAAGGPPVIQGGAATPPGVASIVIDGKPDLPGVDGVREGQVQTDNLDRLDVSKHLPSDGAILPPGEDPAHENAEKANAAAPLGQGAPAQSTADPVAPKTASK